MFLSKLKPALSVVLILGVMPTGATFLACRTAAGQDDKKPSIEKRLESDPQSPKSAWYITDAPFVGFRVVRPLRTPTLDERKSQLLDAVVPVDGVERGRTDD